MNISNPIYDESISMVLPWVSENGVYHSIFFHHFLQWQLNDMVRGKKIISIVSITLKDKNNMIIPKKIILEFNNLIREQLRNTDFTFQTDDDNKLYIILLYTGLKEVNYLTNRLKKAFSTFSNIEKYELVEAVLEIRDGRYNINSILTELNYIENSALLNETRYEAKILQKSEEGQLVKIAIIDDNELTHTILKNLIFHLNNPHTKFDVSHYKTGEHYLQSETYRSSHIQLVLISDILPERDGIEILQQLRQLPNESKYFVIVLGSRNTEEEIIYAMEQGADDYIAKPFNINLLTVKIKRMLERGI